MSIEERIRACQTAVEALIAAKGSGSDAALAEVLAQWSAHQRGTPVYVADSSDFHNQYGDDRRGAYDMEDRMNELAAMERDRAIDTVMAALPSADATAGVGARVLQALDALGAQRLGPYDQRAVRGALWQLEKLLESSTVDARA
ncbi:MAG: hypothetical protein H6716_20545 [Polyangiaceae bacterium]|nr:hypothetical protein [Polyangiaceae bacterium]